jgi:hypothetical protein
MTVGTYLQRWMHYVHIQLLHGIFVSDRYYLLQLVGNLSPMFRDSIGRRLSSDAVEKAPIDRPLPNSFAPDQIHIKLVELARHASQPPLMIKTPRELHRPTRDIRSLAAVETPTTFGQMVAQISAPDSAFPPQKCFFCGKTDCTLTTCPAALAAKTDPFTRRTLVKYFGIRALDLGAPDADAQADHEIPPAPAGGDPSVGDLLALGPDADDTADGDGADFR